MAMRTIPVVYIQSKNLLLQIKNEGPNSFRTTKAITIKDVNRAIENDERLLREIKEKINPDTIELLEEIDAKYEEIKDTDEWKSLCGAHDKINEYLRLLKFWKRDDCFDGTAYDEIKKILDQTFLRKYHKIVNENIYKEFYAKRTTYKYSTEAYYITHMKNIEESIEELKRYCKENPSKIRGMKKHNRA